MEDDILMMVKEDVEIVGKIMVVRRSPRIYKLLFSVIVRVYFMYEFYLIWN